MHDGQCLRVERRESTQLLLRALGEGDVIPEWSRLNVYEILSRFFDDIRLCERLGISELMKKIRTEQGPVRFFEEQPCIPSVRQVGGRMEAELIFASRECFV